MLENDNQNLVIRRAASEDVLGMHDVFLAGWLTTYPNEEYGITVEDIQYKFSQALLPEKLAERRRNLSELSDNEVALVLELAGRIIGVCRASKNDGYNELKAVYILPEFQGQGFGRMMFNEASKIFDKNKKTIVHVASYNEKAIGFYQKLGFVSTGKIFMDSKHALRNGNIIPELEMEMLSEV